MKEFFEIGLDREIGVFKTVTCHNQINLNLGAGNKEIPNTVPLDLPVWNADTDIIPYESESISIIYAYHFLEHVIDPIALLKECQRVLKPGGLINIVVPYYSSQLQAMDLDHKHSFSEKTWCTLFDNKYYSKYDYDWKFQINFNVIFGIVERNICLFTQLEKIV